ncbi:MAG: hypothetical protein WA745_10720, partial [Methylovirgula sp.]
MRIERVNRAAPLRDVDSEQAYTAKQRPQQSRPAPKVGDQRECRAGVGDFCGEHQPADVRFDPVSKRNEPLVGAAQPSQPIYGVGGGGIEAYAYEHKDRRG